MGVGKVESSHDFSSNPSRLTYRKGVLFCSGSNNSRNSSDHHRASYPCSSPNITGIITGATATSSHHSRRRESLINPRASSSSTTGISGTTSQAIIISSAHSSFNDNVIRQQGQRRESLTRILGSSSACGSSSSSSSGTATSSSATTTALPTSTTRRGSKPTIPRPSIVSGVRSDAGRERPVSSSSSQAISSPPPSIPQGRLERHQSSSPAAPQLPGRRAVEEKSGSEDVKTPMAYLNQQTQQQYITNYETSQSGNNNMPSSNNNGRHNSQQPQQPANKEFIPSFVLVDASKSNNERKIRELVRPMTSMCSEDVDPIVNFQDSCGRTALSYGCASGNLMIIDELSKLRRLDPNRGDNENNTPLHYASQAGHSEVVDLLLSRFDGIIDPNCRNSTGLTPLMKAALQGRTRCAKSLISAGASAHLRDYSRGMTAAEWARLCGRHICAEVILRCAKDNYQTPHSPTSTYARHRPFPVSQSAMELKKLSDESPYYHLYTAHSNTISGASWLKNKIKKALGSSSSTLTSQSSNNSYGSVTVAKRPESFALLANLTGPTICAGSLLLPSIKPLIDQQKPRLNRKLTIPVLQVTPVNKR